MYEGSAAQIVCYTDSVSFSGDDVANLTLTIDDEVLKKARIHALERGTSVNALVREYLERVAHDDTELEAIVNGIDAIADAAPRRRVSKWTRDELYAERLPRR